MGVALNKSKNMCSTFWKFQLKNRLNILQNKCLPFNKVFTFPEVKMFLVKQNLYVYIYIRRWNFFKRVVLKLLAIIFKNRFNIWCLWCNEQISLRFLNHFTHSERVYFHFWIENLSLSRIQTSVEEAFIVHLLKVDWSQLLSHLYRERRPYNLPKPFHLARPRGPNV